ncbi:MAG: nucleoside-diphosphate kinase [Candidatus Shapirobacteria bacterium]|jgi:nucleoside-diphosphate kinase
MNHIQRERTLAIVKPDGLQRSLVGEIMSRIERTGLKLVAVKFAFATEDQCWEHYNKNEEWFASKGQMTVDNRTKNNLPIEKSASEYGKDIIRASVKFMTSGPLLMMVWEGNQAVGIVKKLVGGTEPLTSDVGTIRGDLTLDSYELSNLDGRSVRNLIHCTDKVEESKREIDIWFTPTEILSYRLIADEILYDINFDGKNE